jgi:vacuolar-type H+-ATPase subunit C/Vma6
MGNFQNSELLEVLEDRGYPIEYLLSRIRGRRAKLITDWKTFIYETSPLEALSSVKPRGAAVDRTPEGIWRNLLREYRWVYSQMNGALRQAFSPFFLYTELRTLFICLRHIKERKAEGTGELLSASLLSGKVKEVLLTSEKIEHAIGRIERVFLSLSSSFGGLGTLLEEEGLRGVEQRLTNRYLVFVMSTKLHPLIRTFFSRVIDARNILGLYKALRMNAREKPEHIPGGDMTVERLNEFYERGDLLGVTAILRDASGIRVDTPDITKVETALYRGITRDLRKEGRDPLSVGLILDYLWRCSIEATNLSILVHTRDLERETVSAELVY